MKLSIIATAALSLSLIACTQDTSKTALPEGSQTETFAYNTVSLKRGVKGSYNTSPKGRPHALVDVTYTLRCIAGTSPSAEQRLQSSKPILDDKFLIAPIYYANPRERGRWRSSATSALVTATGCEVIDLRYKEKTTDTVKVMTWALQTGALKKMMQ